MQFVSNNSNLVKKTQVNSYFNKNMNYYICSYGGCGSTVLFNYLSNFGNVYHIHDRYPPKKLQYVGKENTNEDVYNEWFNGVEIPDEKLDNYKVIFIYRHPIQAIFSRFAQTKGPNIPHLQHIKCANNGNINIYDVIRFRKDFYGIEEFFDNYTIPTDKNYEIYSIKYEAFWSNIRLFNYTIGIPDVKELYPVKQERLKTFSFLNELTSIYSSLISKINRMYFIELIKPIKENTITYEENTTD
jgi:hypothetical protein